jgi:anoctamin-10/anoctamin-7
VNLNEYENHRTDTDYEDNLIAKIFIFQLVNSFAALTYVSFIKSFLGLNCIRNNCIYDASATLSTIFIIRLVTQLITEVFVRRVSIHRYTHFYL